MPLSLFEDLQFCAEENIFIFAFYFVNRILYRFVTICICVSMQVGIAKRFEVKYIYFSAFAFHSQKLIAPTLLKPLKKVCLHIIKNKWIQQMFALCKQQIIIEFYASFVAFGLWGDFVWGFWIVCYFLTFIQNSLRAIYCAYINIDCYYIVRHSHLLMLAFVKKLSDSQ